MTELDAEIGPLALELINEYGKLVTYSLISDDIYDVETGTVGDDNPADNNLQVRAIVEDYSLQGSGQGFAAGLIERGDKKLTVAAKSLPAVPTTNDTVIVDGTTYKIVNVKITYSGDLAALYELQGRQ